MVMAVLVLLAVTVWGVSKVDRAVEARRAARRAMDVPEPETADETRQSIEEEDLANVAVIAVAIALAQDQEQASYAAGGSGAEHGAGSENDWVSQGRARQRTRGRNMGKWALTR